MGKRWSNRRIRGRVQSQHAICPRAQSPEKITWHGRHLAPEPRVPQHVKPHRKHHDPKRRHVQHHSRTQAEQNEQGSGPRVPPAQQRAHPFPLRRHVTSHRLHPSRHAPQPIIPHTHQIRAPARRERVQLLVQLIGPSPLGPRKPRVHAGRAPRTGPVVPQPDEQRVEKNGREYEFRVTDEDEEQDVD
ncbi:magnesium-chelatase subunit chlH [Striga asiatica]|uniref:Magnesium-chelatase subunit chlH n=1 Tax=Striga asiatica TaxID=4170 RepID=A0A5A7QL31_STRAF|nr:magnesium-chelatase subunit chlH [Striga asiatica]